MKAFLMSAVTIVLLTGCKQSETKVETSENPDGTVTTKTVETTKDTGFDSVKINSTLEKTKEKLNTAGEKIDEAADKAGEKLRDAGQEIREVTAKGAEKVEKSAAKAKEDLNKK